MINLSSPPAQLNLGYAGDNEYRTFLFDVSDWKKLYPDCAVSVMFQRPDLSSAVPVVVGATENPISWTLTRNELDSPGMGKVYLKMTSGNVIGQSPAIPTSTGMLPGWGGVIPALLPDWVQNAIDSATNAEESAIKAKTSETNAQDAQISTEAAKELAEDARDEAIAAKDAVQTEEAARVIAENDRVTAESVRAEAESLRSAAEGEWAIAEDSRVADEESRVTAESNRVTAESLRVTADGNRETAEGSRGTAETARATAETARNVFETYSPSKPYAVGNKVIYNGSSYLCIQVTTAGILPTNTAYFLLFASGGTGTSVIAGYVKAGSKTAIAPTDTVNQAMGKLEAGVDANGMSITELNADVDFNVTNLVTNGDLETNDNWTNAVATGGSISIVSNLYKTGSKSFNFIATGDVNCYIWQQFLAPTGNKIYTAAWGYLKTITSGVIYGFRQWAYGAFDTALTAGTSFDRLNLNSWQKISNITVSTNGGIRLQIGKIAGTNTSCDFNIDGILTIDLTAAFGAGNEPTAAEMDAMLAFYPNSWFNGTVNLASNPKMLPYLLNQIRQLNTEKTSYGVYSGLGVTQQTVANMTVAVATGVIYMDTGRRFTPTAITALAVTTADATNPRIDIVYVNSSGVIAYLAGTAAASPSAPSVPTGGQLLAQISVAANAAAVVAANIADRRKNLWTEAWFQLTLLNGWTTSAGAELKCRKDSANKVHLSGKVLTGTQGTVIAVLPSGYRPLHQLTIFVANNAYNNILLNVATNGNLIAYGTYTGYVSFDNVSFYIDA